MEIAEKDEMRTENSNEYVAIECFPTQKYVMLQFFLSLHFCPCILSIMAYGSVDI